MPTFQATPRFERDWKQFTPDLRARLQRVVTEQFVPDLAKEHSAPGFGSRVFQAAPGVFEMTWAPDGRATFSYGQQQRTGEPHVIWRRIGTHQIFRNA